MTSLSSTWILCSSQLTIPLNTMTWCQDALSDYFDQHDNHHRDHHHNHHRDHHRDHHYYKHEKFLIKRSSSRSSVAIGSVSPSGRVLINNWRGIPQVTPVAIIVIMITISIAIVIIIIIVTIMIISIIKIMLTITISMWWWSRWSGIMKG